MPTPTWDDAEAAHDHRQDHTDRATELARRHLADIRDVLAATDPAQDAGPVGTTVPCRGVASCTITRTVISYRYPTRIPTFEYTARTKIGVVLYRGARYHQARTACQHHYGIGPFDDQLGEAHEEALAERANDQLALTKEGW